MNDLGYYSDTAARLDTDSAPGDRKGERCLNCDQLHHAHFGWACSREKVGLDFDGLEWDERYLTVSMRQSRGYPPKGKFAHLYVYRNGKYERKVDVTDMSDWRAWAKVEGGNCACNIPKHQCKYHGTAKVA
jgi:hypothetical protein